MNTQDSVNQILGMAMIGGKLTGIPEKRAAANHLRGLKESADNLGALNAPLVDAAKTLNQEIVDNPGNPMARVKNNQLIDDNTSLLSMQESEAAMRKEIMLKEPTMENAKAFHKATTAVTSTQLAIKGAIARRDNMDFFRRGGKSPAPGKDAKGGKPDGK